MKKIVQLNVVCSGSTGNIMLSLHDNLKKEGFDSYCIYGRGQSPVNDAIKSGNKLSFFLHVFLTRIFNKHCHGSYFNTKKIITTLKQINPDIIHLHNIHGYWINEKLLMNYLSKEYKGKIIWTLHDCWAFTGHCSHFFSENCYKWQEKCYNCPLKKAYPKSMFFDTSSSEYKLKKKLFTSLDLLNIVVPSNWLNKTTSQSFLSKYPIKTIYNGVDNKIFKYTYDDKIYLKYNIPRNKKIILGVANVWSKGKGLDIFLNISNKIPNDVIIVLVGLNDKQISLLPKNIIGIKRTSCIEDLVKLYSIASVFMNPSLEETFSLVTVEALSCGTPVVISNTTALSELITGEEGILVNSKEEYFNSVMSMLQRNIDRNVITKRAKFFSKEKFIKEYLKLYKEVLK